MSEIICQLCRLPCARYKNGKLTLYSHSTTHTAEILFKDVLDAVMRGKGKGVMALRNLFDENQCIFG